MNQLSNIVIDLARYRRAAVNARPLNGPDLGGHRRQADRLVYRWRRDGVSGRLICVWASTVGAHETHPPSRRYLAA